MGVPAAAVAATGAELVLLRHQRDLAAVEELQHDQEHLVADGIHPDHAAGRRGRATPGGAAARKRQRAVLGLVVEEERNVLRGRVSSAEEVAEEKAAGGEDAAVGVDEADEKRGKEETPVIMASEASPHELIVFP
ncbi:hypothetical protein C4D60_Mb11t05410 [Musa balbisiana]|uniref:Uncharacterized protein n=1 Tax=Musa balbisiana TaxID=52838 RepID=A0A4S8J1X2_MUSBA|nr:hypothetical protein C4D60_Mb11t05410 [Musa balbisiana]